MGECSGDENNRGCRGRGIKHTANSGGGGVHCRTVNHGGDDNDDYLLPSQILLQTEDIPQLQYALISNHFKVIAF